MQLNEILESLKELRECLMWGSGGYLSKRAEGKIEELIEKLIALLEMHVGK